MPGGELLAAGGEQRHVRADEDEPRPGRQVPLGQVTRERVDAGGLARGRDRLDRVLDRARHLGVGLLAEVTERRGQVGRAEEDPVDAVDRRDLGQRVEAGP